MITLANLLAELVGPGELAVPDAELDVGGITDDSRQVQQGDLFVAVAGARSDGHEFASAAVAAGAVAVLAERPLPDLGVPVIVVPQLQRQRSELAARMFDRPGAAMCCVGVTGTNGKTSVACYVAELATALGESAGYMGTIGWGTLDALSPSGLTTEGAITIQRRLAGFREQGLSWAVLEASSHALDQHRIDAVGFDYAVFTNLSRDHLDYHDDLESYAAAKARLFRDPHLRAAVVNVDDDYGRSLADSLDGTLTVLRYGLDEDADVRWSRLSFDARGVCGQFRSPWGVVPFRLPLYGEFSVANAAAALAVLCHAGFDLDAVAEALSRLSAVPGRMELFPGSPSIVVDYAHTPDALEKMLDGLRPHAGGLLICVCGCGGDRDRGKRPLMARAALGHADRVWFTSDNPRSEKPAAIIEDMLEGVPDRSAVGVCVDRRSAIERAVAEAGPDDLVVVAGKGHEDYQEIAGRRLPFSDRAIAATLTGNVADRGGS